MNLWVELERWLTILLYVILFAGGAYLAERIAEGENPWDVD